MPARLSDETREENFTLRDFISRQASRLTGFVIFIITGCGLAALSTWNAEDPSLSHATDKPISNLIGYPGAIFSDLAIQLYGLSSIMILIPALIYSFMLMSARPINSRGKRLIAWVITSFLFAGAAACLPVPLSWILPTGLGGVIGDLIIKYTSALAGKKLTSLHMILIGASFACAGMWFLFFSSGIIPRKKEYDQITTKEDIDDIEEPDSDRYTIIGHITHIWLSIRASLRRKKQERNHPEKKEYNSFIKKKRFAYKSGKRIEPDFFKTGKNDIWPDEEGYNEKKDRETSLFFEEGSDIEKPLPPMDELMKNFCPELFSTSEPADQSQKGSHFPLHSGWKMKNNTQGKRKKFELPPLHFLTEGKNIVQDSSTSKEELYKKARILESVLEDFGVKGEIIHVRAGPVVTLYELEPAPGIKSSRVIGLADDIARSMSAVACRVAVVPGRNAIGIELPNLKRETVYLREILNSRDFQQTKTGVPLALGKSINGEAVVADITKMPHVIVAGTTGSGKSVAINTMILSILYKFTPDKCRLIMIDPKMLELSVYEGIPHLLTPVVTEAQKALTALKWTVREMEERYRKMSKIGVRNIDGFNTRISQAEKDEEQISRTVQTGFDKETGEAIYETEIFDLKKMPYIIVIIDEMADLMMVAGKDIEGAVQRLAQMARAAGIHVVMATQRPSVDVITGTIKANFPTRISFQVTSKIDSRTILGEQGAEQLLGMGDMLFMTGGGRIRRVHGPFVSDSEVEKIVKHLKLQGEPEYLDAITLEQDEDKNATTEYGSDTGMEGLQDTYFQAREIVLRDQKASTSYIQRRLGIGYNRAASIIERMEKEGVIGKPNHAGKREILIEAKDNLI